MVKETITKIQSVKNTRKNAKNKIIEKEVTTTECRYYISSKFVNIEELELATRGHWSIENNLHWHLDFTFCQDASSTLNKSALMNLEVINKFVLAVLSRVKPKYNKSMRSIRDHIGNNVEEFFPELVCHLTVAN